VTKSKSSCILCGSPEVSKIASRKNLIVDRCPACDILLGSDITLNRSLDSGAVETDPNHFEMLIDDEKSLKSILQRLLSNRQLYIQNFCGSKPKNWLEIGPGNGLMSDILKQDGAYWLGVEIDANMAMLMQAANKNVINADFAKVDVQSLLPDHIKEAGGFDIIFFSQVFEHVTAPNEFLRNAISCLRPGGVLYADVPNNDGLTAWLRRLNPFAKGYGEIVPPHHLIAYGAKTLNYALRQAGFENISSFGCAYNDPTFGLAHAHLWDNKILKLLWAVSKLLGMGGNLVVMAKKPG
jgi:SAM-dependent methyltransferase